MLREVLLGRFTNALEEPQLKFVLERALRSGHSKGQYLLTKSEL